MRVLREHPRSWAVVIAIAIGFTGHPAWGQRTVFQADAAVNVGYNQSTRTVYVPDPNSDDTDIQDTSIANLFTEIRPGISVQTGSPRVSWRFGYQFSTHVNLADASSTSIRGKPKPEMTPEMEAIAQDDRQAVGWANSANLALAAQLTQFTTLTANAAVAQGGTAFLQSQRAAEEGRPEVRAPDNPNMVTATLSEGIAWEVSRKWSLQNSFAGNVSAQQDDFKKRNSSVSGTLALERLFARDTAGLEVQSNVSWLRPLRRDARPYKTFANSLRARWNHDFSWRWNGLFSAGVEQVFTDTGSRPLAFLPSGAAALRYTVGNIVAVADASHGTATNLQVGAVSLTDQVTLRGVITFDPAKFRTLAFSGGFLHNEPLGETASLVSAGTGNAMQGDAGFTTAVTKGVLASIRYSVAYQFDQAAGLGPTLAHVFFVGVTASYSNLPPDRRPMPGRGLRVDRGDVEGFPVVNETPRP